MDAISGVAGSSAWSQDTGLMQKLDETYRKHLRPNIDTDRSRNSVAKAAWESYCFELSGIFSKRFPDWESTTPFFQDLSREYVCLGPIITSSYIEDMGALWTEVQPALLEVLRQNYLHFAVSSLILSVQVTRWLEPFIDYGPNYRGTTRLYDAPIALGCHARELFNRRGGLKESAMVSTTRANNVRTPNPERTTSERHVLFTGDAAPLRTSVRGTKGHAARDGVCDEQRRLSQLFRHLFCCRARCAGKPREESNALARLGASRRSDAGCASAAGGPRHEELSSKVIARGYRSGKDPQRDARRACADGTDAGQADGRKVGVLGWDFFG